MSDSRYVVFGNAEDSSRAQLERCLDASGEDARGVLCADNHKGHGMPVGGVVASERVVMPGGVGFDIGCGNCAVRTDVYAGHLDTPRVMDEIWKVLSFGIGQKNGETVWDHPVYDRISRSPVLQQRAMLQAARQQLGTIGSGNHYVDLFVDTDGWLWVGVHFGSRGFGYKTASGFLALAQGLPWDAHVSDGMDDVPSTIPIDSPMGQDYLEAMAIAGEYAAAGREWVVDRVCRIVGARQLDKVHNHHNFAWLEEHGGRNVLVTRKGATPAFPGQRGFVGSTMFGESVILEGVESEAGAQAFYSTVHGAGRVLTRNAARGKVKRVGKWRCQNYRECTYAAPKGGYHKDANGPTPKCPQCGHKLRLEWMQEQVSKGIVDFATVQAEAKSRGIELRGAGADEAPQCYKDLEEVLAAHAGTVRVLHRLRPIGVAMAGLETVDPFKD